MKTRIYYPDRLKAGMTVTLMHNAANHVARVLRLRSGDTLTLFNGSGSDFSGRIESADRNRVEVLITDEQQVVTESPLAITLLQGICRSQKMDMLMQKSTELGVQSIVPVMCSRSLVRVDDARQIKKVEHWRKIVIGAAEQCGRAVVPHVEKPLDVSAAIELSSSASIRFTLDPSGTSSLSDLDTTGVDSIAMLIGPEGGLTETERREAEMAEFEGVRMGPRILRTETAPIAALSILQFLAGDI